MDERLAEAAAALADAPLASGCSTDLVRGVGTVEQPLAPLSLADFLDLDLPPREMLLAPILSKKSISMLFGPRGLGKTFMALGIALAVASAGRFLRWSAPHACRVLYIDGEMQASTLQSRLQEALVPRQHL